VSFQSITEGQPDFTATVSAAAAAHPDLLYIAAYGPEAGQIALPASRSNVRGGCFVDLAAQGPDFVTAATPGRAGVDVAGEVGDLDQVIELVGHERHERVPELVRRPVPAETRPLAELTKVPAEVLEQKRRPVPGTEDEPLDVIETQELMSSRWRTRAATSRGGDRCVVETWPSSAGLGLRTRV
jgi:hypothetical protein